MKTQHQGVALAVLRVSTAMNVPESDLFSRHRIRRISEARMLAMSLTRAITRMSLTEIGEAFERDHTTVLSAVRRVREIAARDKSFAAIVAKHFPELLSQEPAHDHA